VLSGFDKVISINVSLLRSEDTFLAAGMKCFFRITLLFSSNPAGMLFCEGSYKSTDISPLRGEGNE